MECIFGLVGDGFALVVADTSQVQSIVVQKTNEDKIMILDSHKLLGVTGESGDRWVWWKHRRGSSFLVGIDLGFSCEASSLRVV
jgi:20S proteasome alpha/beta subunit